MLADDCFEGEYLRFRKVRIEENEVKELLIGQGTGCFGKWGNLTLVSEGVQG